MSDAANGEPPAWLAINMDNQTLIAHIELQHQKITCFLLQAAKRREDAMQSSNFFS